MKHSTTFKISLAILLASLIVLVRAIIYHDTGLFIATGALFCLVVSSFSTSREIFKNNKVQSETSQAGKEMQNHVFSETSEILLTRPTTTTDSASAFIHYILHLGNPESSLKAKVGMGLRELSELMPDKIFACYHLNEDSLHFLAATRTNSQNQSELIDKGDSTAEELETRIKNLLGNNFTKQLTSLASAIPFSYGENGKDGIIMPVALFGRLQGIMVALSTSAKAFTNNEKSLMGSFCEGMALVFDNHQLYFSRSDDQYAKATQDLTTMLFNKYLAKNIPTMKGWDIAQKAESDNGQSDRFHDYIHLPGNRLMIVTAQSSGKGLGSAIFFTRLKTMIACLSEKSSTPAALLNTLSTMMMTENAQELFASMAIVELHESSRHVVVALAGHSAPVITRHRSGFTEIPQLETGIPLGLFTQGTDGYQNQTIQLLPGDGILLYTDRVAEFAQALKGRPGIEELKFILDQMPEQNAAMFVKSFANQLMPAGNNRHNLEDYTVIYAKAE
ncbi:MAG: serine/threonine-protein phosphatase [Erysipelotrichia bacterium]|nr:serine/threonine-protein phosphatase [Erysipelotrichia bacterium]